MNINVSHLATSPIFVRLGCLILALLLLWLPFVIPIYLFVSDINLAIILALAILYLEFIFLLIIWGKYVYKQTQVLKYYGLELSRKNLVGLIRGLAIGFISVLILFVVQGLLGWFFLVPVDTSIVDIVLEGLLVSLALGFAEELVFRGWLLDELSRDYPPHKALWASAVIFAILHVIRFELILLLELIILGAVLVWAKRWGGGRLGTPIGLHAGLFWGNYIVRVGELVQYSEAVPEWMTGINGNPLAGLMGLGFLSTLAWWMRSQSMKIVKNDVDDINL